MQCETKLKKKITIHAQCCLLEFKPYNMHTISQRFSLSINNYSRFIINLDEIVHESCQITNEVLVINLGRVLRHTNRGVYESDWKVFQPLSGLDINLTQFITCKTQPNKKGLCLIKIKKDFINYLNYFFNNLLPFI